MKANLWSNKFSPFAVCISNKRALACNHEPIGSAPAFRVQCTLPPQPISQTLFPEGLVPIQEPWMDILSMGLASLVWGSLHLLSSAASGMLLVSFPDPPRPAAGEEGLGTSLEDFHAEESWEFMNLLGGRTLETKCFVSGILV